MSERPIPTDDVVRRRFSQQKRADTRPEMELRRELHRRGLRFRVGYPVPGKPRRSIDVAFTRVKVAVFVDGCFWHRCPRHYVEPTANADWWIRKITMNVDRDRDTSAHLESLGWKVLRYWEHDPVTEVCPQVAALVTERQGVSATRSLEPDQ